MTSDKIKVSTKTTHLIFHPGELIGKIRPLGTLKDGRFLNAEMDRLGNIVGLVLD